MPYKRVGSTRYYHRDYLDPAYVKEVRHAEARVDLDFVWNVVKITNDGSFTFLKYARFMTASFPELEISCKVPRSLPPGRLIRWGRDNPPILHRKELLLPEDHPQAAKARAWTRRCEKANLFRDTRRIGRRKRWQAMLKEAGLR